MTDLRRITGAAVAAATLIVGTACSSAGQVEAGTQFERAKKECAADNPDIRVLDDGYGLDLRSDGNETVGASIEEVVCVLLELQIPDSVIARMDRTRALDGTQNAEWGDVSASWTYHPDVGMSVILEQRR